MNVSTFLAHWNIEENPFLAEEARQDPVLDRLERRSEHPDFAKILGDPGRPATSVVFGEKGTGKTAIRLQIQQMVRDHNENHPERRTLVLPYDDLNPILDRFVRRFPNRSPEAALSELRLVDHVDGLLSIAVPDAVDGILGARSGSETICEPDPKAKDRLRQLDTRGKEEWVILQALYDRNEGSLERSRSLRRHLRYRGRSWVRPVRWLAAGLLVALLVVVGILSFREAAASGLENVGVGALVALTVVAVGRAVWDAWKIWRLSRRLEKEMKVIDRASDLWRHRLSRVPRSVLTGSPLPVDGLDDPRYAMLENFKRAIGALGYQNVLVLVDRVDEPSLINGEADRMRAFVWPLFNNKFLQQERFALKMLLPIELRHELNRQSREFFQEARLDKQNMIDRLVWSGTTLYDLCSNRLAACTKPGEAAVSLIALFEDSATRQDIVDALDQMRQPRDAFKMMYQVIQEHCASSTDEEENWQIPKLVLDQVKKKQVDRLDALQRGLGPA